MNKINIIIYYIKCLLIFKKINKKTLITGIAGQDGNYLAELLLDKKYKFHRMMKKSSSFNAQRINQLINSKNYNKKFFIHYGVLIDSQIIFNLINKIRHDEIYNLVSRNYKSHN